MMSWFQEDLSKAWRSPHIFQAAEADTCENTSTLWPCSFSFLSIFCNSVSFPEALVSADPS